MVDSKKSFEEWLNEAEWPTPEESARNKAEREAFYGTMWEWAQMQPNGDIAVRISDYGLDGTHGFTTLTISVNDETYDEAKRQYGLDQPGDTFSVTKKLVDGNWVVQKDDPDTAKSA